HRRRRRGTLAGQAGSGLSGVQLLETGRDPVRQAVGRPGVDEVRRADQHRQPGTGRDADPARLRADHGQRHSRHGARHRRPARHRRRCRAGDRLPRLTGGTLDHRSGHPCRRRLHHLADLRNPHRAVRSTVEDSGPGSVMTAAKPAGYLRDPYPFFAERRRGSGVFHGTVIDYSRTPESLRPTDGYAAMSFDAVNRVLRDGRVFSSALYDTTIGLFTGPTLLAMEGGTHRAHRNLISAAFKTKALARWEPSIVRPIVNALIDEFIDTGTADLVRDFTFEFPTRVI